MNLPVRGFRLILDQGLPGDAAAILRQDGWQCDHLSELGMSRTSDTEIVAYARERQAVIVTLDADFHTAGALEVYRPFRHSAAVARLGRVQRGQACGRSPRPFSGRVRNRVSDHG